MYHLVYDASGELRFESGSWPMAREALNLVISETPEPSTTKDCPRLFIGPDPEKMIAEADRILEEAKA
ncbi:hypothetical protein [Oscillibacter sp.]|uniref:hypothetical protein n=1 Tax=Oscillibacter sp. TaxID=1945593 RepID=UPI002D7FE95B|nr:hypothetical protein [Oscillibacter sp.]